MNYISNIDIQSKEQKRGKHNIELVKMDALEAFEGGQISFMQLNQFIKTQQTYKMLKQNHEKTVSDEEILPKQRHSWIYGASNTGKTFQMK